MIDIRRKRPTMACWFCSSPAHTIGYGFAVCLQGKCAEKARLTATELVTDRRMSWPQ